MRRSSRLKGDSPVAAEFCVVCGRTDRPTVDGLCASCALDRLRPLDPPSRVTLTVCPTCGSRSVGGHWEKRAGTLRVGAHDLNPLLNPHPEVALRRVRWEEVSSDPLQREMVGEADLRFRDLEATVPVRLKVLINHQSCPECSRRSGGYYAARIQLRGPADSARGAARLYREQLGAAFQAVARESRRDIQDAISWREDLPEGVDIYLTDTVPARTLARAVKHRYGAAITESASLYGRKDGREVYRVTLLLRLPLSALDRSAQGEPSPVSRRKSRPVERHA